MQDCGKVQRRNLQFWPLCPCLSQGMNELHKRGLQCSEETVWGHAGYFLWFNNTNLYSIKLRE